jgi:hypothetical protein
VHFVNNIHLIFTCLRRDSNLVNEAADIVNGVVVGSIQFENIESSIVAKSDAGGALIAGFKIGGRVGAVDGFCQDARTGGLSDTTGACKQKRLRQLVVFNGTFQGSCNRILTNYRLKGSGAVFSCRYNEIFHVALLAVRFSGIKNSYFLRARRRTGRKVTGE